ncbi:MAG: hypothetical protein AB4057_21430 [Crocosphaera sp.]
MNNLHIADGGFISLMRGAKSPRWETSLHNYLKTYLDLEHSLVHVAATRAIQEVNIIYYGKPSPFLTSLEQDC